MVGETYADFGGKPTSASELEFQTTRGVNFPPEYISDPLIGVKGAQKLGYTPETFVIMTPEEQATLEEKMEILKGILNNDQKTPALQIIEIFEQGQN